MLKYNYSLQFWVWKYSDQLLWMNITWYNKSATFWRIIGMVYVSIVELNIAESNDVGYDEY